MNASIHDLGFKIANALVTTTSRCFRPPSWPPPKDWVVSEDVHGNPFSLWGGPNWDFSAWAGKAFILNFSSTRHARKAAPLGLGNQHVLRMLTTEIIWGPNAARSWAEIRKRFNLIRRIVVLCDGEGVPADEISRYPKLLERASALYTNADRRYLISILDRLHRSRHRLGFMLMDEHAIAHLSKIFAEVDDAEVEQTAYIPPRIWTYQNLRLRECLDEFLGHRQQVEDCFRFCVDAYAHNFGSLADALCRNGAASTRIPFSKQKKGAGTQTGRQYQGPFELTARTFGIDKLLEKWVITSRNNRIGIKSLAAYLTLVQSAGFAYIANFTLQRKEEAAELRSDCLMWDQDPVLGRIATIRGDTTKTDPDSDAWWPTCPSVEVAITAMTAVAMLRVRCATAIPLVNCTEYDKTNPYLFNSTYEPWSSVPGRAKPYTTRPAVQTYESLMKRYPLLFDPEQLRITEDDLITARMFTPNLDKKGKFRVGKVWPLAYHQLRRTGAVNMFASGLLSDTSIQAIMKHLTLRQTQHYGRNFSRVRSNEEYDAQVMCARYEVMGKQIAGLVDERYVSPLGAGRKQEILVNMLTQKEFTTLVNASKNGEVSFRETRLGGCTKRGHCAYGGIESISRCSGGDGDKPCRDAIFDRNKKSAAEEQLVSIARRINEAKANSPRKRALEAEANGLRNFLDAIKY